MLTLEQVRAVNDALKNGDLNAALRPLEETIDLRHAEMPRLEKSAVAALKSGLQTPENARFWAEALFHPNVSVRRFARKTLLGLKGDAAPIAAPLRARLEQFWAEETPIPESFDSREAAQRREQQEIVQSAVQVLLRADADAFMYFFEAILEAPSPLDDMNKEWRGWEARQQAYTQAVQRKHEEIFLAEWGEEFKSQEKRWQLPWRIWREINDRVQADPEVQQLLATLGESPWQRASHGWQCERFFQTAMNEVLSPEASGPQQEIGAAVRPHLWRWLEAAFDETLPKEKKGKAVARAHRTLAGYWQIGNLGYAEFWRRVPELLSASQNRLDNEIEAQHRAIFNAPSQHLGALWIQLAGALAQSCHKPYNVKSEWVVPDHITPELLRSFKAPCKDHYSGTALERAAQHLEKERAKAAGDAAKNADESAPRRVVPVGSGAAELASDWADFESGNVQLAVNAYGNYVAVKKETTVTAPEPKSEPKRESKNEITNAAAPGEAEETVIADAEKVVQLILNGQAMMQPDSYARAWKKKLGEANLKEKLWPRVGPLMWQHYEATLERYRRVESEEPDEKLTKKLTERELKEWKSQKRREKRSKIVEELNQIAVALRAIEDVDAELRFLQILQRPGLSEVAFQHLSWLLQRLGTIPHQNPSAQSHLLPAQWWRENWFLDERWQPVIAQADIIRQTGKRKDQWQHAYLSSMMAIVHYRLNTPQSRAACAEIFASLMNPPHGLSAPVVALGDVETWLILVDKVRWPDAVLSHLWERTRQNTESEDARQLTEKLLHLAATTSEERGAKFMLEMLGAVSVAELEEHAATVVSALESPLIPVKRWALKALLSVKNYDHETAATLASEMLWNESGALVKDAAKFLGVQSGEAATIAWEALQDAASLENISILEAVFRALAALKGKNKELQIGDGAREKLAQLSELSPDRFEKFSRKLGG